jgi:hypothetical protein
MLEFDSHRALLVDLYELTMAAAYFEQHVDCHATFELFARQLPPERTFLVAGGIEDALDYLADLQFSDEDVSFLRGLPVGIFRISSQAPLHGRCRGGRGRHARIRGRAAASGNGADSGRANCGDLPALRDQF